MVSPTNFPGTFKVHATSDLAKRIIQEGAFEPELTALLKRFVECRGDIVNIGANVGFYTVFFAMLFPDARRVLAIEPNPEAIELLKWNIEYNNVAPRVDIVQACIGERAGQVELAFVPGKSEYSSIDGIAHPSVAGHEQKRVTVDVVRLTEVASDVEIRPELLFVDTEGAELDVLKGAEDVIRNHLPIMFFECEDALLRKFGYSSQELDKFVASLGYEVRDAMAPDSVLTHPFSGNAIAIPTKRKDWLAVLLGARAA